MPYRLQIAITSRGDMTAVIGGCGANTFAIPFMSII